MTLSNYLFFTATCESALAFYGQCGMGKATVLLRHGVGGMRAATAEMQGKVAHAVFEGPGILFYASDNHDAEPMRGSAHFLTMDSREETDRLFARLSEGGLVTTPLAVRPWGGYYGKLTDKFGVQWMMSVPPS
jgi:PhnB protein